MVLNNSYPFSLLLENMINDGLFKLMAHIFSVVVKAQGYIACSCCF